MADSANDWRTSLTASERYENIQIITQALAITGNSTQSAFGIENEAYKTAASREEYNSACTLHPPPTSPPETSSSPPFSPSRDSTSASPGIRIGPYQNCHYLASGATSEVYRTTSPDNTKLVALKVIVETYNIAPHNPHREGKLLASFSSPNLISLLSTFHDQNQRLVLALPYYPLTLGALISSHAASQTRFPPSLFKKVFISLFSALEYIHNQGIIHRDIKPAALLLSSDFSEIVLSDFGTAWHPSYSPISASNPEPVDDKVLDVGTGPYRAPEVLFGDKSYGTAVDIWAAGCMIAECTRLRPLFESRGVHEDGNQLGLILSIFKTMGSPTRQSWPEAEGFRTPPFDIYTVFPERNWEEVLPEMEERWRGLVEGCVKYESGQRMKADEVLGVLEGGELSD
ncbi:putative Serine/threonine-protein kinase [Podospora australis]|uniref:cyclin-dependent kinase n=1 Tax=Podospora australis TaxID=1536484 RepID=A0AAN6WXS1_9PEZI|nr:putative Serine/threonine-protein kinase [Podospora australis]